MYYHTREVPTLLITWQPHTVVPNKTEIYIFNKKRKNATAAPYCMLVPWSVALFAVYLFLFFFNGPTSSIVFVFPGLHNAATGSAVHTTPSFDKFIPVIAKAEILHHNARETCTKRIILLQQKVTGKV